MTALVGLALWFAGFAVGGVAGGILTAVLLRVGRRDAADRREEEYRAAAGRDDAPIDPAAWRRVP